MENIFFFDSNRNPILEFFSLEFEKQTLIRTIKFRVRVKYDFFTIESEFNAELNQLILFEKKLSAMYELNQKVCGFSSTDGDICLLFKMDSEMKIHVECKIRNVLSTAKFIFEYEIDQSYLPELISEINEVLKELKRGVNN